MKKILLVAALCSLHSPLLAQVSFTNSSSPSVGSAPAYIIAADVNRDGKPDLITANYGNAGGNTLSVLTNNFFGGFALASSPVVGTGPRWVTAADVNGDGKLDLIAANYGSFPGTSTTLSVLTNNGRGVFALASSPVLTSAPFAVLSLDINGDGKADLITANADNTVEVLTNSGNGYFVQASSSNLGGNPRSLVAFTNVDGKVDLISANQNDGTLSFMTNNGSGGFGLAALLSGGNQPFEVAVADVNADGKMDVISANYGDNTLSVWTNNGVGGFGLASSPAVGNQPFMVAAADVNGDGKVDLISANLSDNTLTVLTNNGNGGFSFAATLATGSSPEALTAVDVNGDGKVDLISANGGDNSLTVWLNTTPTNSPATPPLITLQPTNHTVNVGQTVSLNVSATGTVPLSYQWRFGTTNIVNATNTTLTLVNVQLTNMGNYSVVVSNPYGSTNSTSATLTVVPAGDPAPSGLIAWWRAEGNANDSVGSNNGSPIGNLGYTNGEVGQAFVFDGSTSYIPLSASASLNLGTNSGLTIECWIKPTANVLGPIIEWDAANTDGLQFWAAGILNANLKDTTGTAHVIQTASSILDTNNFQHVAMTYDQSSGNAVLYRNGTVVATNNFGTITPQTTYPVNIGRRTGQPIGLGDSYGGLLDELSLYNRALSSNEIAGIYNAGSAGKLPPPSTPPMITLQPTNQTVNVGQTVAFSVSATGTAPLSYQWRFGTTNIANATNTTLTLVNVQLANAGNYSVVVSNPYGSTNSATATLTVNSLSLVPAIARFSPASAVVGTSITLTGTNFSSNSASNLVYFGAVRASVLSASTTNLVVAVPVSATYAPITVTVNGLTAYANQPFMPTFLGDGSGITTSSFAPRQDLSAGNNPYHVIIADIDGDGKPDLIVANVLGNSISVYRNIGTNASLTAASFAPRVDFATTTGQYSPWGLAVADVDGDGKLDIVTTDYSGNMVSIFRNTSTAGTITSNSFAARLDFATGSQPQGVEVRDIDGDGHSDLLVANSGDGTISIFRNIGVAGSLTTNSFAPRMDIPTGSGCQSIVTGDLDGDGKPDVVAGNSGVSTISLLRNTSTPGIIAFAPKADFTVPNAPSQMSIGDLDGDGKADLTVACYLSQTISVFRNISTNGSLTANSLAPRNDYSLGGRGHTPAIADMDGDGKPDLAVVTELNSLLSIFRNVSTPGSFTNTSLAGRVDFGTGWNAWGVSVGDLNGDGRPDVVFCNQYDGTISIYQNQVPFGGPPVIVAQPTNQTVNVGQTVSFSVSATGTVPLSYQWRFGSTNLVNATNTTLTLVNVQLTNAGNYSVVVSNPYGSTNSTSARLTVVPAGDPAPSGLVAWWRAEGNANDSVGTNNGITQNITYTNGEVGQAFVFNGSSSQIRVPANPLLNVGLGSGFTVELWVNPANLNLQELCEWNQNNGVPVGAAQIGTHMEINESSGDGSFWGNIVDTTGISHNFNSATGLITTNSFQHLAMTYDKTSGLAVLYRNGTAVATANLGSFTPQTSFDLFFGNRPSGFFTGIYFSGEMDEPSIYNRALSSNEIAAIYNAGSAGKLPPPSTPPSITLQPTNQTVNVGQTVAFSVSATGTSPLNYQWRFGATNIVNATNTTLTLMNVQLANAGNYSVVVSNPYGSTSSTSATLTVLPAGPTVLTISSTNGMSGSTLTVPVLMSALGVENAFAASVNYDNSKLVLQKVQLGQATAGAYLLEADAQTNNGSVGFAILLNSGVVVPAGTQEVARLVFTILPVTTNMATSLTFGDSPTTRQIYDNNLNPLPAVYRSGTVSLTPAEYEADVYPRTSGDHQVTVQDWLEVGRMVAGLDKVANSDEKLRADCAPRNAPDGVLTVADWVQAGRYALGLDPLTLVSPPAVANQMVVSHDGLVPTRILQLGTVLAQRGQAVNVPVQLIGNASENAVGLTVIYNPSQLAFISAALDPTLAGGRLNVNPNLVAGNVGLTVALPPGGALGAGTNQLVVLQFLTSTNASGTVPLLLDSSVVQLQVADLTAVGLPANYVSGSVVLPPAPTLQTIKTGNDLQLTWSVSSGSFLVQTANSPAGPWDNTVQTIVTNGTSATVTVQATNQQQYFRLISQ